MPNYPERWFQAKSSILSMIVRVELVINYKVNFRKAFHSKASWKPFKKFFRCAHFYDLVEVTWNDHVNLMSF